MSKGLWINQDMYRNMDKLTLKTSAFSALLQIKVQLWVGNHAAAWVNRYVSAENTLNNTTTTNKHRRQSMLFQHIKKCEIQNLSKYHRYN